MTTPRLLSLLACLAVVLGAPDAQAQYALRANVVAAGATDASGGGVRLRGTLGQPAVGRVAGGGAAVGQGFWYPATLASGGGPALSVTATPLNPPVVVPAGGGEFRFRVTIRNNTAQSQTFQAWINATLPNGSTYHVLGPQSLTLGPNATFGPVTLRQRIPGWAPAGTYAHNVRVGTYPNNPVATGSFPWAKSGAALGPEGGVLALGAREGAPAARRPREAARAAGSGRTEAVPGAEAARRAGPARMAAAGEEGWRLLMDATGGPVGEGGDLALAMPVDAAAEARITAEEDARSEDEQERVRRASNEVEAVAVASAGAGRPAEVVLVAPSPNPFTGRTTFRFTLPEDTHVRLTVYDLLGRAVAMLVDEPRAAGWHEGTLDGAALASGVYVARLEAGGQVRAQRVSLLR